jgi:low temperature requirement protein LtrA
VSAVAQVGTPLGDGYTRHGLVRYALMFLLIWWAWFGHMMYSTRFNANDVVQRRHLGGQLNEAYSAPFPKSGS